MLIIPFLNFSQNNRQCVGKYIGNINNHTFLLKKYLKLGFEKTTNFV